MKIKFKIENDEMLLKTDIGYEIDEFAEKVYEIKNVKVIEIGN